MSSVLTIGIVGGGFSGTALAAMLYRLASTRPIKVLLFDKSGQFGLGPAYQTPYPHHLLNVRAEDMSPFEDDKVHFVTWLNQQSDLAAFVDTSHPVDHQFVPRCLYARYLQDLLKQCHSQATLVSSEVVEAEVLGKQAKLTTKDQQEYVVDKAILALGNNPPSQFPFHIAEDIKRIDHPWDYEAVSRIPKEDAVLIVGTGLSMIDAVLTLHQHKHAGKINAVSRHGLLPLRHADGKPPCPLAAENLPKQVRPLTKALRTISERHVADGYDWRTVINAFRRFIPEYWQQFSVDDKKRFLRHALPYWNIHRHRVHVEVMDKLDALSMIGQLQVHAARVLNISQGAAELALRHTQKRLSLKTQWVINCMGPAPQMRPTQQRLIQSLLTQGVATLDPLQLGFVTNTLGALVGGTSQVSDQFYTLGAPARATFWECGAVPEIRRHIFALSRHLLA